MIPEQRQGMIIDLLAENGFLSLREISRRFDISMETVRRDVRILASADRVEKVYGGVRLKDTGVGEPSMDSRLRANHAQKSAIAAVCAAYVEEGDCIYLDSGSTTFSIAPLIKGMKNVTVLTNSLLVVNELVKSDLEIILIGGRLRHEELSVVTFNYLFDFDQLNVQKCFIGIGGCSLENGISDYHMIEASTRKQIMERSKRIFVATDSTKIGKDVTVRIAGWDELDVLITDRGVSGDFAAAFPRGRCRLVLA